jgi:hypothetical protein
MLSLKSQGLLAGAFLLAFMLGIKPASAEFTVSDPSGVFASLKRTSSVRSPSLGFEREMGCGSKKTFTAQYSRCEFRCTTMFCSSRCESAVGFEAKFDLHVEECSATTANVFGDNGISLTVSKSDFDADGTWVRALMRGLGQFVQPEGELVLLNHWQARVSRLIGGKKVAISNARQLEFDLVYGPSLSKERWYILLDMDKTGLDQFLAIGQGLPNSGGLIFALERGVLLESPGRMFMARSQKFGVK